MNQLDNMFNEQKAAAGAGDNHDVSEQHGDDIFTQAVMEHAQVLGMDVHLDAHFLWLAEEALLASLPKEWEQYDDENDNPYYFNCITGESVWENPLDEPYRRLFRKLKREYDNGRVEAADQPQVQHNNSSNNSNTPRLSSSPKLSSHHQQQRNQSAAATASTTTAGVDADADAESVFARPAASSVASTAAFAAGSSGIKQSNDLLLPLNSNNQNAGSSARQDNELSASTIPDGAKEQQQGEDPRVEIAQQPGPSGTRKVTITTTETADDGEKESVERGEEGNISDQVEKIMSHRIIRGSRPVSVRVNSNNSSNNSNDNNGADADTGADDVSVEMKRCYEYLVRWKGSTSTDDEWFDGPRLFHEFPSLVLEYNYTHNVTDALLADNEQQQQQKQCDNNDNENDSHDQYHPSVASHVRRTAGLSSIPCRHCEETVNDAEEIKRQLAEFTSQHQHLQHLQQQTQNKLAHAQELHNNSQRDLDAANERIAQERTRATGALKEAHHLSELVDAAQSGRQEYMKQIDGLERELRVTKQAATLAQDEAVRLREGIEQRMKDANSISKEHMCRELEAEKQRADRAEAAAAKMQSDLRRTSEERSKSAGDVMANQLEMQREIDRLICSLEEVSKERDGAKQDMVNTSSTLEEERKKRENVELQLSGAQGRIAGLDGKHDNLARQVLRLEGDKESLDEMLSKVKKERDTEFESNLTLRQKVAGLEAKAEALTREKERAVDDHKRALETATGEYQHVIAQLQEDSANLQKKLDASSFSSSNGSTSTDDDEGQEQNSSETGKAQLSAGDNNTKDEDERKNESLERQVDKLQLEVELLEKDAERMTAETQARRDEVVLLEDELGAVRAQVVTAQEKAGANERQVQRVDTDRRVLQEAVDVLKSELKDEMDGAENARKQLASTQTQLHALERKFDKSQHENDQDAAALMRETRLELDATTTKLRTSEREAERLRQALVEASEQATALEDERKRASQLEAGLAVAQAQTGRVGVEIENLKRQNVEAGTALSEARELLEAKEGVVGALRQEVIGEKERADGEERKRAREAADKRVVESRLELLETELKKEATLNHELRERQLMQHSSTVDAQRTAEAASHDAVMKAKQLEHEISKLQTSLDEHKADAIEHDSRLTAMRAEVESAKLSLVEANKLHKDQLIEAANKAAQELQEQERVIKETCNNDVAASTATKEAMAAALVAQHTELEQSFATELSKQTEESKRALAEARAAWDEKLITEIQKHTGDMVPRAEMEENISVLSASAQKRLMDMSSMLEAKVQDVQDKLKKEVQKRRILHNKVVDLQGTIRVFCRVRPVLDVERSKRDHQQVVSYPADDEIALAQDLGSRDQTDKFEFDRVFDLAATQIDIFEQVGPLVGSALDGYNVCIFAYGQTGSGKTHTMTGPSTDPGVNIRALGELFTIAGERTEEYVYSFKISMLEIYNEQVVDLLVENNSSKAKPLSAQPPKLDIRQGEDGLYVPGLTLLSVANLDATQTAMELGNKNRTVGAHDVNQHSSRSHLVVSVYVVGEPVLNGDSAASGNSGGMVRRAVRSKLNLIDLAGSERLKQTSAKGTRLEEAKNINKSLSALGDVIGALSSNKRSHVPFRNSKLTYLLQDSLSGSSKVLMFVNISPVKHNAPETLCSLNFAARCRAVVLGQAKKNTESQEVSKLKRLVEDLQSRVGR